MKILLTGFEPFGGSPVNPSIQVVNALASDPIENIVLHAAMLPVTQDSGPATLVHAIESFKPDTVLCLGQNSGRSALAIERVAINLMDYAIADNSGALVTDKPIVADGPAAYFVTLPVRALLSAIREAGVPAELSLTAGTFLCNQVLYTALHHIAMNALPIRAGFIHVPPLPEQVVERLAPSMGLETSITGVRAALSYLSKGYK
ncbi:MAG TPA: pyroglutamyl-peptidase I [Anaerolineae bacterium]|jgi:pyroglutamyl-peptidase